jgi:integrase
VNEIENRLARGDSPLPDPRVKAWECFEQFKQDRAGRLTDKSMRADHYRIELFLKSCNIFKLSQITDRLLKAHLDTRITEDKISHQTANHTIRALKTFLNFCVRNKLIVENPLRFMAKYSIHKEEPRFLTHEEILALLAAAKDSEIYLPVILAVYTGMRYGEIERICWEDIDFNTNWITVKKSKAKRFRRIPLLPDLKEILLPLRSTGRIWDKKVRFFEWRYKLLQNVLKEKKIPAFRFHDLRHTFASIAIRSGINMLTLSKTLGHSTISTTEIYAHLYQDHIQEEFNKFKI